MARAGKAVAASRLRATGGCCTASEEAGSASATYPGNVHFVKGHGTENDFVLLPPGEVDDLSPDVVRALCHRRRGVGADGVLRVVATDRRDPDVRWFMDYRNADGSVAEMCGNGIRVFARFLV